MKNMNLQELLKDTKTFGKNLLIAEFKNGYAVAYEKNVHQKYLKNKNDILATLLTPEREDYSNYFLLDSDSRGFSFSKKAQKSIDAYLEAHQMKEYREVCEEGKALYQAITAPLQFEPQRERDWSSIGMQFLFSTVGIPLTYFFGLHGIIKKGSGLRGCLTLPFLPLFYLGAAAKEIIRPDIKKNTVGNTSALFSNWGEDRAELMPSIFDDEGLPRIMLPEYVLLSPQWWTFFRSDYYDKFQGSFFEVPADLREKATQLAKRHEEKEKRDDVFKGELLEHRDQQIEMLKHLKFMEETK